MYQLIVKGKTVEELKEKLQLMNNSLNGGEIFVQSNTMLEIAKDEDITKIVVNTNPFANVSPAPHREEYSTPSQTQALVSAEQLDAENLPWDARIHSSAKSIVASGRWKQKKNVDPQTLSQVKAELYSRGNPAQASPTQQAAPQIIQPPTTYAPPMQQAYVAPVAQAPVVAAAPIPSVPNGHTLETFRSNFPLIVANLITQGKLNQEWCEQTKAHYGFFDFAKVPDAAITQMYDGFAQYGFIQKV